MTPRDLDRLLKVCKKYGVTELATSDFKVKIDSYSPAQAPKVVSDSVDVATPKDLTEEDVMFWSSPSASSQE